tara:strand:+ start:5832 stop:6134 length:303 start_codon:yes stop_codon:yes gene_type:complete
MKNILKIFNFETIDVFIVFFVLIIFFLSAIDYKEQEKLKQFICYDNNNNIVFKKSLAEISISEGTIYYFNDKGERVQSQIMDVESGYCKKEPIEKLKEKY